MPFNKEEKLEHPNIKARVLPHSIEAEQAVLGCIMIDEDAPIQIMTELTEEDFYSKAHGLIFTAMMEIAQKDKPVDIITLVSQLEGNGNMERVGGLSYLTSLTNAVQSSANYKHYMEIVQKTATLRKLITVSNKIADKAFTGDNDETALTMAEAEIFGISEKKSKHSLIGMGEAVAVAVAEIERKFADPLALSGVPTSFKLLDHILGGGLQNSDLILIAARPGQGKTSIGMNFIQNAALNHSRKTATGAVNPFKCAVFSLEMPAGQLAKRMICAEAKVSMTKVKNGQLTQDDWKKITKAQSRLASSNIFIDDSSLTTPIEILSKCRRLKREKGLDLIMIDYLQLMSSGKRVESRQQEVSDITRTMKIAAKELNVPILLLSQMSRDVEKRNDKTPAMSDLRESGAIEQDADIIMFIHRPHEANDPKTKPEEKDDVELIIAKHRNGETGKIPLKWNGETVSFMDVDNSAYAKSFNDLQPTSSVEGKFISTETLEEMSAPIVETSQTTDKAVVEEVAITKERKRTNFVPINMPTEPSAPPRGRIFDDLEGMTPPISNEENGETREVLLPTDEDDII